MSRGYPSMIAMLALAGLGVRVVPIDEDVDPVRDRLLNDPVSPRRMSPRKAERRGWHPSSRAVEYIHTDKPVSKRRARRQRGKGALR